MSTYAAQFNPTDFWSWKKIEAGHYVLTTDEGYTATVRKHEYITYSRRHNTAWTATAASPSGSELSSDHATMADAKEWAFRLVKFD